MREPETELRLGDPEAEEGAIPIPIPHVPEPIEEIDPEPIWRETEPSQVGMDPDPVLRVESELPVVELSNLPIPIPDPGMEAGFGDVGALPVPVPDEADLIPENDLTGMEEEPFEEPLDMG